MEKAQSLLRVLRAQQEPRITQSQLARKAQRLLPAGRTMSPARYWQIESGEGSAPSDDERQAIATVLGVQVSEIAWPDFENARAS